MPEADALCASLTTELLAVGSCEALWPLLRGVALRIGRMALPTLTLLPAPAEDGLCCRLGGFGGELLALG